MMEVKKEPIFAEVKKEPIFPTEAPAEPKKDAGPTLQPEFDNVTAMIEDVLRETRDRFQAMADQIIHRIDEMTQRVDSLEKNIADLMVADSAAAATTTMQAGTSAGTMADRDRAQ